MSTGTTYGSTSTVLIGELDLSIYDSADKQLVWRGVASKTLDPTVKPGKKQRNINKAVSKASEELSAGQKVSVFS